MIVGGVELPIFGRRCHHVVGGPDFEQVGARAKPAFLTRADQRAAHIGLGEPTREEADLDDGGVCKHIDSTARPRRIRGVRDGCFISLDRSSFGGDGVDVAVP